MPKKSSNEKKAYDKAYYEANKEKKKAYREAHKGKLKAYGKAYYEANKEKRKAYDKAYGKAYYEANKEKKKAYMRDYRKREEGSGVATQKPEVVPISQNTFSGNVARIPSEHSAFDFFRPAHSVPVSANVNRNNDEASIRKRMEISTILN
jgi:ABC-type nitrate/sulfonate/bicarbonate transport system substrate-binding protein